MRLPESAREWFAQLTDRLGRLETPPRIVFPEGQDSRVQEAAERLARHGLVEPILISGAGDAYRPEYASLYYERRKNKGISQHDAEQAARRPLYTAALMVAAGDADGFVGGAANTTAQTVRAVLHCIGPASDVRTVSSCFVVAVQDRSFGQDGLLIFADCAIVIDPSGTELAEIAIASAGTARNLLKTEALVALLSFSTRGSAQHTGIDKITEALRLIREREPGLQVDGELQVDAALVPSVGQFKAPGSAVAGHANTLIFPDATSGNIGVKLVERLGGALTLGPFLQGLARPANDLSRGCSADDIYGSAIITALQSLPPPPMLPA